MQRILCSRAVVVAVMEEDNSNKTTHSRTVAALKSVYQACATANKTLFAVSSGCRTNVIRNRVREGARETSKRKVARTFVHGDVRD